MSLRVLANWKKIEQFLSGICHKFHATLNFECFIPLQAEFLVEFSQTFVIFMKIAFCVAPGLMSEEFF